MRYYLILPFPPYSINTLVPGNITNIAIQTFHRFVQAK